MEKKQRGRPAVKNKKIIELHKSGMKNKDIAAKIDSFYGYVCQTINNYKKDLELQTLRNK